MSALRAIYGGCKQLGIEEDDRRDLFERVTGKRSLKEMTPKEHEAVIADLRSKGFRKDFKSASNRKKLQGKYAGKLQALWIGAWNLGIVNNRSDDALTAFIKRQTKVDHTRFLRYGDDANKAIEALKGWMARDGNVDWSIGPTTLGHRRQNGYKIALAQWVKLPVNHPEKACNDFIVYARGHGIDPATCQERDWIPVMNALGKHVRALT